MPRKTSAQPTSVGLQMPVIEKVRFLFQAIELSNDAPICIMLPDRDHDEPCHYTIGADDYYTITASTWRGGIRRACAKIIVKRLRQGVSHYALTLADSRLLRIGGSRGSGQAPIPNPAVLEQIRQRYPHLELFGFNDPTFFAGCVAVGMALSVQPIRKIGAAPNGLSKAQWMAINDFPVVRTPTPNDRTLEVDAVSMEMITTERAANRKRSQINNAIDTIERLERKQTRGTALTARELREMEQAKEAFQREAEVKFASVDDAKTLLDNLRKEMIAQGISDVSEQNVQHIGIIPSRTAFNHLIDLGQEGGVSLVGAGLFMDGWNYKTKFNPFIGGLSARGCGGLLRGVYKVRRMENDKWVDDCTIKIAPYEDIEIVGSNSLLQKARDAWKNIDMQNYAFDFKTLSDLINGRE